MSQLASYIEHHAMMSRPIAATFGRTGIGKTEPLTEITSISGRFDKATVDLYTLFKQGNFSILLYNTQ
ncbi:hypothetical protein GCM10028805_18150 [Spirosoma harenae]